MSVLSAALAYRRLVDSDAALQLLRADQAPVILTILNEHLGGQQRRRPVDDLYELVDAELDLLREHFALPQTAKAYCAVWREAGWLIRRPAHEMRGETLELAPVAVQAIRVMESILTPRVTATESRLVSIRDQLHRLAAETDPDTTRRLAQLERERDEITAQIEKIETGELDRLDDDRARERLFEILQQAEDVPSDFVRLRTRFEQLNHGLRVSVLESDEAQRSVLDEVFRGVDLIEQSDEGQTFQAFSALVLDAELSAELDSDIAQILDRDFVGVLTRDQRRFLRTFLRRLRNGSTEIHDALADFARGLRRYVQSQEFQRDRALRQSLRGALAAGVSAAHRMKPFHLTGQQLALSTVPLASVGALRLHDPGEYAVAEEYAEHAVVEADLEALRALARETEIDFAELTDAVNQAVGQHGTVTVAEVLDQHPATQGVASVIGLVSLATLHGDRDEEHIETVVWFGVDGVERSAAIPMFTFSERIM